MEETPGLRHISGGHPHAGMDHSVPCLELQLVAKTLFKVRSQIEDNMERAQGPLRPQPSGGNPIALAVEKYLPRWSLESCGLVSYLQVDAMVPMLV